MKPSKKNILVIILLIAVNAVGFFIARNYFSDSTENEQQVSHNKVTEWFHVHAKVTQETKWMVAVMDILKFYRGN